MSPLSYIFENKLIAIVRGAKPEDVLKIARSLHEGGIRLLEITMNTEKALPLIEEVSDQLGDEMLIGAGTVLDAETVQRAVTAGAKFILSPTFNIKTIEMTKHCGAVSIPGAFTATEILEAYLSGGDIIKVFPARLGADYIKDIRGPLPHIPLLPTGGVSLENIKKFQEAGAAGFGIGSALVDTSREITDEYLSALTEKAKKYVQAVTLSQI